MSQKRNAPGRWNGARAQYKRYAKLNDNPLRPVAEYAALSLVSVLRRVPAAKHAELRSWIDSIVGGVM